MPFDEVTDLQEKCQGSKFGIVYGINSFGLSQDLSITRKAAEYIERYFGETYPRSKFS